MRSQIVFVWVLGFVLFLTGCSASDGAIHSDGLPGRQLQRNVEDAGVAPDTGAEAASEAGAQPVPDAGADTDAEAGQQVAAEAGADSGVDAAPAVDAGSPDAPWRLRWDARTAGLTLPAGLVAAGSPSLDPYGIRGGAAVRMHGAARDVFRANGLASLASGDLTIVARVRRFDRMNSAALFGFGASKSTTTYLEGRLSHGTGSVPEIAQRAASAPEALITPAAEPSSFADHVMVFTRTASGATTASRDGVEIYRGAMGALPVGLDEFAFFGSPRGAALVDAFDGWVQTLAVADRIVPASELAELEKEWLSRDPHPKGSCPKILFLGDSYTIGAQDRDATGTLGVMAGIRYRNWEFARNEGLCFETFGTQSAGFFPEPAHGARSSYGVTNVAAQFEIEMARPEAAGVDLISFWIGASDYYGIAKDPTLLPLKILAYRKLLERARTLAPGARLLVATVTPWDPNAVGATSCLPWNAAVLAMLDEFDAAHPGEEAIRVDPYGAVNGTWNNTLFFDISHPGPAGFDLIAPVFWQGIRPVVAGLLRHGL